MSGWCLVSAWLGLGLGYSLIRGRTPSSSHAFLVFFCLGGNTNLAFELNPQLLYLCLFALCEEGRKGSVRHAEVQDKAGDLEKYPDLPKIQILEKL